MAEIYEIIEKISYQVNTAPLDASIKVLKKNEDQLGKIIQRQAELKVQLAKTDAADLEGKKKIGKELQSLTKEQNEVTLAMSKTITESKELNKALENEIGIINNLERQISALNQQKFLPNVNENEIRKINNEVGQLENKLKSLTTASNADGGGLIKKLQGSGLLSGIAGGIIGGGVAGLVTTGIGAVGGFLSDAIAEAAEAEENQLKLRTAILNTKNALSEPAKIALFEDLVKFADDAAIAMKNLFDNDAIVKAEQKLVEIGKFTADEIKKIIPIAGELAAKLGIDIPEATDIINNSIVGKLNPELKRLGVNFGGAKTDGEKLNILLKQLGGVLKGQIDVALETSAGKAQALDNRINGLKESIGAKLLPLKAKIYEFFNAFLDGAEGIGKSWEGMFAGGEDALTHFSNLNRTMLAALTLGIVNLPKLDVIDKEEQLKKAREMFTEIDGYVKKASNEKLKQDFNKIIPGSGFYTDEQKKEIAAKVKATGRYIDKGFGGIVLKSSVKSPEQQAKEDEEAEKKKAEAEKKLEAAQKKINKAYADAIRKLERKYKLIESDPFLSPAAKIGAERNKLNEKLLIEKKFGKGEATLDTKTELALNAKQANFERIERNKKQAEQSKKDEDKRKADAKRDAEKAKSDAEKRAKEKAAAAKAAKDAYEKKYQDELKANNDKFGISAKKVGITDIDKDSLEVDRLNTQATIQRKYKREKIVLDTTIADLKQAKEKYRKDQEAAELKHNEGELSKTKAALNDKYLFELANGVALKDAKDNFDLAVEAAAIASEENLIRIKRKYGNLTLQDEEKLSGLRLKLEIERAKNKEDAEKKAEAERKQFSDDFFKEDGDFDIDSPKDGKKQDAPLSENIDYLRTLISGNKDLEGQDKADGYTQIFEEFDKILARDDVQSVIKGSGDLINNVYNGILEGLRAEIEAISTLITKTQGEVDAAQKIADRGNAQAFQKSIDKLEALEAKKRQAEEKEMAFRKAEKIATNALAVTYSILAIAKAAAAGSGVGSLAMVGLVISALASGVAFASSIGGGLRLGTDDANKVEGGRGYDRVNVPYNNGQDYKKKWFNLADGEAVIQNHDGTANRYRPIISLIRKNKLPLDILQRYNMPQGIKQVNYDRVNSSITAANAYQSHDFKNELSLMRADIGEMAYLMGRIEISNTNMNSNGLIAINKRKLGDYSKKINR